MIQKRLSISVMAVAALAVFAVAAALLLSGGNPAQATTAETRTLIPDNSGGGHLLPLADDTPPTRELFLRGRPVPEKQATPTASTPWSIPDTSPSSTCGGTRTRRS